LSLCLIKHPGTKMYGRVEVQRHVFLTMALDREASDRSRFTPATSLHGGSVDSSRSRHYGEQKRLLLLPRIEPRFLDRPACSLATISTGLGMVNKFKKYDN
jgi:hypothetical protein